MASRISLKGALHCTGGLLSLFGIIYVAQRISAQGSQIDFSRLDARSRWGMVGLAALYGLINVMLGLSWWHLLASFGASVRRRWAVHTYGVSSLAKYVPGNVFHLASRQALGMSAGIAGWTLAKTLSWELALLVLAGALFAPLLLPLQVADFSSAVALAIFMGVVGTAALVLRFGVGGHRACALLWQVAFLGSMGVLFAVLAGWVAPDIAQSFPWPTLAGGYVVAWLIGLVTPGAPAGLGVREGALLLLLNPSGDKSGLLLALLLMRLITIGGDVVFFLFSLALDGRKPDAS